MTAIGPGIPLDSTNALVQLAGKTLKDAIQASGEDDGLVSEVCSGQIICPSRPQNIR